MTKQDSLVDMEFPQSLTLDREVWQGFVELRKKKGQKAPLTAYGARLILRKLDRLQADGYDPNACLEQSIERGWSGVFETPSKPALGQIDGKPRVVVMNTWLAEAKAREEELSKPENAAKSEAARLAAMKKMGRA